MIRGKKRVWGFDEQERALLFEATADLPELRALVERAEPRPELGKVWVVTTTVDELDAMYDLVEALTDATRSRKRLDLLDGLRASLCTSMDGF